MALDLALGVLGEATLQLGPAAAAAGAGPAALGDIFDRGRPGGDGGLDGAVGDGAARADVHG